MTTIISTPESREKNPDACYSIQFALIGYEGTESEVRVDADVYESRDGTWGYRLTYTYADATRRERHGAPHCTYAASGISDHRTAQLRAVGRAMGAANGGFPLDWDVH